MNDRPVACADALRHDGRSPTALLMGALFGSLAAIAIGTTELFGRRIVAVSAPVTASFVLQLFATCSALVSALVIEGSLMWGDTGWGLLSGVGMAVGVWFYFVALARSSATVVAPTVATLAAIIPYIYALLQGSDVTRLAVVGAIVAFIGLAVIAVGTDEVTQLREGLLWGGVSGIGFGVGLSVFIEVGEESGAWPAVAQRGSAAAVLGVAALVMGVRLLPPRVASVDAVAAGLFGGLSSVALILGFQADAPSTVVTSSMFPVMSVILGFVFFRDSVVRRQVYGIALALVGIALVVGS